MTNDKQNYRNDPRLTAYALGEIEGAEAEAIRAAIANDPEALAYVEDTKLAANFLSEELVKEAQPRLAVDQREKLLPTAKKSWFNAWTAYGSAGLVAAGVVAVVISGGVKEEALKSADKENSQTANRVVKPAPQPTKPYYAQEEGKAKTALGDSDSSREYADFAAPVAERATSRPDLQNFPAEQLMAEDRTVPERAAQKAFSAAGAAGGSDVGYGKGGALGSAVAKRRVDDPGIMPEKMYFPNPQPVPGQPPYIPPTEGSAGESYSNIVENPWLKAKAEPLSTFSIDVDTASYANVRRMLNQGMLPPRDAVRIEELVNYFPYSYSPPTDGKPFAVHVEMADTPWTEDHQLVRIALRGKDIAQKERPKLNLTFLVDVSGSMDEPNKLPLLQESLKLLVDQMQDKDRISLVVYAGASGVVLPPTSGDSKRKIKDAIDNLKAGGSTNGGAGIELAYKTLQENFTKGAVNRVILASDGDFNVGVTSESDLEKLIAEKAKGGSFLSVLGFGMGNYKDSTMVKLADKGNGNYAYIDTISEAKKALVEQMAGTLITIAKDVKIQVEFNPAYVSSYRLVGYEKRLLSKEDFNNDKKDAGEIGAGHTVTALYEIVPAGKEGKGSVDPLKYQPEEKKAPEEKPAGALNGELLTVKLRYKEPDGSVSKLIEVPVKNEPKAFVKASGEFQFATSVAAFGMMLRDSEHKGVANFEAIAATAAKHAEAKGKENEHRKEFVELVRKAAKLKGAQ